jgi:alkylhydroperoxidase family enzyme
MTRIPLVDPDDPDLDPAVRRRFSEQLRIAQERGLPGKIHNVTRALAHHPAAFEALAQLSNVGYSGGSLPPRERELAYLTTSIANDCHY